MSAANRTIVFDTGVTDNFFSALMGCHTPKQESTALIFGCRGDGSAQTFTSYLNSSFNNNRVVNVVGFDINEEIIKKQQWTHERLRYTHQKPDTLFDYVISTAVVHHGPEELSQDIASLVRPGGFVGIIDYDMVGFDRAEFFKYWGKEGTEKSERQELGDDECFRLHTAYGLDHYLPIFATAGLVTRVAIGRMRSYSPNGLKYFVYVGQKPEKTTSP